MRQEPNEDLEALDDQKKQDWQLVTTEDQKGGGRAHLTIMTDSATEKMRITFEAHQLVSNFFNPDEDPWTCGQGGAHSTWATCKIGQH